MSDSKDPSKVLDDLVKHFEENSDIFKSNKYNETQVRTDFVNPLFQLLGWDVSNSTQQSPIYRDVILEDRIRTEGGTKAPDYAFCIGGIRKFFVETKRPSVNIKHDSESAYQLRRYAWSAKLSLSILTDFEEFSVYDGTVKPNPGDPARVARIMYFTHNELLSNWDKISGIFSRDAVTGGSLESYSADEKRRSGTTVDAAFLGDIEKWREELALNIYKNNSRLSVSELNTAVQRTIDRIIFLRIAEDRGLEKYGSLDIIQKKPSVYGGLCGAFKKADAKYNSGLFHFKKSDGSSESLDTYTLNLSIDDEVLRKIIRGLYYPQSPYEFSVLPADLLGQIYEQFLGRVISLDGGNITVDERPEVQKAGGVYYTPTYIVRYIVQQILGPLLIEKTPLVISGSDKKSSRGGPLRIIDVSCGSGSFLIEAYQYLLDWYLAAYVASGPEASSKGRNPKLFLSIASAGSGRKVGEWRLTIAERRRILLAHIFGVDVDPQAVEVTKLSLLLKVLEGEDNDTVARQMDMFKTRALPDLGVNIRCGNSLIGPDFYHNLALDLNDVALIERINAFDWSEEFKDILKNGGFDAIVGNPPYRRELDYKYLMDEVANTEFGKRFRAPRMDLWYYFVHRGLELLKPHGRLGFIVNSYWIASTGAEKLITTLRERNLIEEIFSLGKLNVFRDVAGQHMVMLLNGTRETSAPIRLRTCIPHGERSAKPFVEGFAEVLTEEVSPSRVFGNGGVNVQPVENTLAVSSSVALSSVAVIRQGIAENPSSINGKVNKRFGNRFTVGEGVFVISDAERRLLKLPAHEASVVRPYHELKDISRYYLNEAVEQFIVYSTKGTIPDIEAFPGLKRHLVRFKAIMDGRRETQKGSNRWWHLHWPREESIWSTPKIIALQMASRPSFSVAEEDCYTSFSTNVIVPNNNNSANRLRLLGILNSGWVAQWLAQHAKRRGVALELNGNVLNRIPIPSEWDKPTEIGSALVKLVEARIVTEKSWRQARAENTRQALDRQRINLDAQIDQIVATMYGHPST